MRTTTTTMSKCNGRIGVVGCYLKEKKIIRWILSFFLSFWYSIVPVFNCNMATNTLINADPKNTLWFSCAFPFYLRTVTKETPEQWKHTLNEPEINDSYQFRCYLPYAMSDAFIWFMCASGNVFLSRFKILISVNGDACYDTLMLLLMLPTLSLPMPLLLLMLSASCAVPVSSMEMSLSVSNSDVNYCIE